MGLGCTTNYSVSISNFYLEGFNEVYLLCTVTPNISSGALYSWYITYDQGPDHITVTTTNSIVVPLSNDQSITQAYVTVSYQSCVFSDNHFFFPPITLSGINLDGDLPQVSLETKKIEVFPNPTTGELNFTGLPLEGYTVSIFDLQGKKIINNSPLDQRISIGDHPTGIYHFIINNASGMIKSGKIIKE